jgi:hypothetical protein
MKALGLCAACLVWLCGGGSASAAGLGDAVPGHPGLTYLALMKQVVTDLQPDGSGHKIVAFQHIAGQDARVDPPETVSLSSVDVMPVPGDASRVVVLADLGAPEGYVAHAALLALFDLRARPKVLDVVEVGDDQEISFLTEKPPALLAPGAPLMLVASSHGNTSRSFLSTEMIFIRGGRFQFIDRISAVGARSCAFERTRDPSFTTVPAAAPYRAVSVAVRQKITVTHEDGCDDTAPKPGISTYRAIYRWNAATQRFATTSIAIKRLSADDGE